MRQPPDLSPIIPGPFEWMSIPEGTVVLHNVFKDEAGNWIKNDPVAVGPFYMARYVITNEQFSIYVQDTGRIPRISHHENKDFNQPLQPIIDLNWLEAMAFCEWISDKAKHLITLPSISQWQRAAQGDDNRRYPWGNDWNPSFCNTEENRLYHTTPVTQFPQGQSPYGVMDMAGNVCEWCLTDENTGLNSLEYKSLDVSFYSSEIRVFSGSHFNTSKGSVDVSRHGSTPIGFAYCTGIRLVTSA
jgi:formylglycine-generating enzyme required for sulfatase activity